MSRSPADPGGSDARLRIGDREAVVSLEGELDLAQADELSALLARAIETAPARSVVVDMTAVAFIDSTVMRVLLRAHRQAGAAGGTMVLRGLQGHPRKMIELAGLHLSLDIERPA